MRWGPRVCCRRRGIPKNDQPYTTELAREVAGLIDDEVRALATDYIDASGDHLTLIVALGAGDQRTVCGRGGGDADQRDPRDYGDLCVDRVGVGEPLAAAGGDNYAYGAGNRRHRLEPATGYGRG